MTKYSKEEKLAAINAVEAGESIAGAARRFGIDNSVLKLAVRSFREHGEEGLNYHTYSWTAEQKNEVLEYMHENQFSYKETGIRLGIRGWR